jgi:hypothetical protein
MPCYCLNVGRGRLLAYAISPCREQTTYMTLKIFLHKQPWYCLESRHRYPRCTLLVMVILRSAFCHPRGTRWNRPTDRHTRSQLDHERRRESMPLHLLSASLLRVKIDQHPPCSTGSRCTVIHHGDMLADRQGRAIFLGQRGVLGNGVWSLVVRVNNLHSAAYSSVISLEVRTGRRPVYRNWTYNSITPTWSPSTVSFLGSGSPDRTPSRDPPKRPERQASSALWTVDLCNASPLTAWRTIVSRPNLWHSQLIQDHKSFR